MKILFIYIWFGLISNSYAVDFFLNKEVIGEAGLKTECFTSSSKKNDYCKTQFAFKWTMYTGESFGQFSIALWGGTDKYASSKGTCGLKFNGKDVRGEKGYIPSSDFTACYFRKNNALIVLLAMLDETRFDFYEPSYNGKIRGGSFYTSDIGLGWLGSKSLNKTILIGAFINHTYISAKRTSFNNAYYGHTMFAKTSPWTFAKVLAKFKYYENLQ